MGFTTARFSLSECTSPSSRSAVSDPVNTGSPPADPPGDVLERPPAGPRPEPARGGGQGVLHLCARLLTQLEGLDHVIDLDVVERPETDTALVALPHLGRVVLEATQRLDG